MEQTLLTVKEVLKYYCISRTAFYDEVKKGKLRIIKRGRRSLISKAEADAWLDEIQFPKDRGDNDPSS